MIKILKIKSQLMAAAFTSGLMVSMPNVANSANNLDSTVKKLGNQSESIPQLINGAFFVAGIGLVGLGLFGVKKHVDSNGQEKLPPALAKAGIGGALMALPILADNAINTVVSGGSGAAIASLGSTSIFP
jgi:hypothetical protein